MDLLQQFKIYLLGSSTSTSLGIRGGSPLTVKNYLADIGQFMRWYKETYQREFNPQAVTSEVIEQYKLSITISLRSRERHLSSLRKFFSWLESQGAIARNPLQQAARNQQPQADPWHMKEFKDYLYSSRMSDLTIKNYINDIQSYREWAEKVSDSLHSYTVSSRAPLASVELIEEYKERLTNLYLSGKTINRKLSSLRKYIEFAARDGYLKNGERASSVPKRILEGSVTLDELARPVGTTSYSTFAPLRLAQHIALPYDYLENKLSDVIADVLRTHTSRKLHINKKHGSLSPDPLRTLFPSNLKKDFYAPASVSITSYPLHKKIWYHARHTRPRWYKTYHTYTFTHYLHFAVLVVYAAALGIGTYYYLFGNESTTPTFAAQPTRVLSFHGRLNDANGTPVTSLTDATFSLYPTMAGATPLWTEKQNITPDSEGNFSALLGSISAIPDSIFSNNNLYLGIMVGGTTELAPRQRIASAGYALDSQLLEGMPPITEPSVGNANVILALDSSGNLTIGGSAGPTFTAASGQFKITGQSVAIATNASSDGDITLAPDGAGQIDVQSPLKNTTFSGNVLPGAVEIDDNAAVLATSSATAFAINQNGTGDVFSASVSGATLFALTHEGNVGVGNASPAAKLQVVRAGTSALLLSHYGIVVSNTTSAQDGLALGDFTSFKSIQSFNSPLSLNPAGGNVGVGTASPAFKLDITDSQTSTYAAAITNSAPSANAQALALKLSGVSTPAVTNYFVGFYNSSGFVQGKIRGNGTANSVTYDANGGDFAEYYKKEDPNEPIGPGDLLCLTARGTVEKCSQENKNILGVFSDQAGFVGAGGHEGDPSYVLVGLVGQLRLAVSAENGTIAPGDVLTSGSSPGVAAKAKSPGFIVGRALEAYSGETAGKILVSLSPSWYDPDVTLTETGGLRIVAEASSPTNSQADNQVSSSSQTVSGIQTTKYTIQDTLGKLIHRIGVFSEAIVGNIEAGFIRAQNLSTKTLTVTTDSVSVAGKSLQEFVIDTVSNSDLLLTSRSAIVSPIASIQELKTNILSPLAGNTIEVKGKLLVDNSAQTALEISGSASVSGILSATNAELGDATVSGTLRVNKIIADSIEGLDARLESLAARQAKIATLAANNIQVYSGSSVNVAAGATSRQTSNDTGSAATDTLLTKVASPSASSNYVQLANITAPFALITEGLVSAGPTTLAQTTVMDTLSIGTAFTMTENSLNVLGQDLEIQPLKQGGVNFLSGALKIDASGNVTIGGDAIFAQNVAIKGALSTHIISPLPDQDLVIQLGNKELGITNQENNPHSKFVIHNSSESAVLSINQTGDVTASGSGTFSKLNLFVAPAYAVDDTTSVATGSAGTAVLRGTKKEITIQNPYVTSKSLIYVTPIGNTGNIVLYLLRQVPALSGMVGSFTVGVNTQAFQDIPFNWIIVN